MGDARVEKPPAGPRLDPLHVDHTQFDPPAVARRVEQPGRVHAVARLEPLDRAAQTEVLGEQGEAAPSVAAHLSFGAVGVVVTHGAEALRGGAERHQAVGADPEVAVAESGNHFAVDRKIAAPRVEEDEIVACTFVFRELDSHVESGYIVAKVIKLLKVLLLLHIIVQ